MTAASIRPLFLPVDINKAHAFWSEAQLPGLPVERAALLGALVQLGKPMAHVALERLVAEAAQQFIDNPAAGEAYLLQQRKAASTLQSREVLADLAKSGVTYAPAEVLASGASTNEDSGYSFGFQDACQSRMQEWEVPFHTLSSPPIEDEGEDSPAADRTTVRFTGLRDQGVVAQVIAAGRDEHIVVNAYAGTGKTHLLHTLADKLGAGVTYLAPSKAHLFGFKAHSAGSGAKVRQITLWELAHAVSSTHSRALKKGYELRCGASLLTPDQQASIAGIEAIGDAGRLLVLQRAKSIVNAWCHSDSAAIAERHVRRHVHVALPEVPRYIDAAKRLWKATIGTAPKGGHAFDITLAHLAKWLAQSNARIPRSYGLLLVDEAHDLRGAWRHLLSRYDGGCVLLGDPNQRLKGNPYQETSAKAVAMYQSVRMGLGAEALVQRTLDMDPTGLITASFSASRDHVTRQRQYDRRDEIPLGGLRVYGSEWALLEDALQLQEAGAAFRLLPATMDQLERLLREAISLRQGHGAFRGVRYGAQSSWEALATELDRQGLQSMLARFERGLSMRELLLIKDAQAEEGARAITLALIEHAKNLESDLVALMDCCFDVQLGHRNYMPSRAAYLAFTRARHEVWLPGDSMDRLKVLQESHLS
jgi:hypothetical protein